jgi:hypothetical protein
MIEVKIGVKTVRGIAADLGKIIDTIDALKPEYASRVGSGRIPGPYRRL